MSNSLAVAMVTAALRQMLAEALVAVPAGGVQNAAVTALRPDMLAAADGGARGINVFLYQVAASAPWAGHALPTRRADGTLVTRPEQALDLHYLLTFSGDENALEPQRMLGAAVTALAAEPVLERQQLRDVIAAAILADPATWQRFSDLPEQVELVRFTPLPLSLDDGSKLWSTFFQSAYRLSVTYQASVVLLDADLPVQPALPVLTRGVDAAALNIPVIARVAAASGPSDPVVPGGILRIEGQRLRGPYLTKVRLGDLEITVPAADVTGTVLTVSLPAATRAGLHSLQIRHPRMIGTPPVERAGAESAAAPVLVRPVVGNVTATVAGAVVDVTVPVQPPVARTQRVMLSLNEHHPPADQPGRAYSFPAPEPAPGAPDTVDHIIFPVAGVAAGTYLIRIQVDGAQSVLSTGNDGRFDAPRVVIP